MRSNVTALKLCAFREKNNLDKISEPNLEDETNHEAKDMLSIKEGQIFIYSKEDESHSESGLIKEKICNLYSLFEDNVGRLV